jgi:NAD(P)H-hydrate epimerase
LAKQKDTALLGPGFGLSEAKRSLAFELAMQLPLPCVLDADALTAIGTRVGELKQARAARVLTPHPGEASRLLATPVPSIERDRCAHALRLAELSGQVVVLKGARTVIASPAGELRICRSGTPALATAGSGDVLSGVIATLCGSVPAFTAAWCGVELHARAGSLAARSDRGLLAGEVPQFLGAALDECRRATSA